MVTTYGKRALLFAGQGPNVKVGMAAALPPETLSFLKEEGKKVNILPLRELLDRVFYLISAQASELPLEERKKLQQELSQTRFSQIAAFLTSAGEYLELPNSVKKKLSHLAGHSVGEITALWAAGYLDFQTALTILYLRSQVMDIAASISIQIFGSKGGMLAVSGNIKMKDIEEQLENTSLRVANRNSEKQIVLSGLEKDFPKATKGLEAKGYIVININVSGAFHTEKMQIAQLALDWLLMQSGAEIKILKSKISVIFNRTGKVARRESNIKKNIAGGVVSEVQFVTIVRKLKKEGFTEESMVWLPSNKYLKVMFNDVAVGQKKALEPEQALQPSS